MSCCGRVVVVLWSVMRFQRGEEGEVLNVSGASESSRRREELSGEQEEEGSFSIMLSIMLKA